MSVSLGLDKRVSDSIDLLRRGESLALSINPEGYYLAFSGGKDSQCLYHLAKMAGVKFTAHMNVTSVDPPELMHFVRTHYPDVQLHLPDINFYNLIIKKKALPLRMMRFCCSYLKERAGAGYVRLVGIRAAESSRRAKRNELELSDRSFSGTFDQFNRDKETSFQCVGGKDSIIMSPIFRWSNANVWDFLRSNGVEWCSLYDCGYHRIGCMFCPMASVKEKRRDLKRYPGVAKAIKRSIRRIVEDYGYMNLYTSDVDEIFEWWLSNESADVYFAQKRASEHQLKMEL